MEFNEKFKEAIDQYLESKLDEQKLSYEEKITSLEKRIKSLEDFQPLDKATILLTSHELDKLLPAFIIANAAASFGMEVTLFCTLWGINGLKQKSLYAGKNIKEKMLTFMLPASPKKVSISRLNMLGIGKAMMISMMKDRNVETLPDLIDLAEELDVEMVACQMTMGIMGIKKEELREHVTYGGVAAYIEDAAESKITLVF